MNYPYPIPGSSTSTVQQQFTGPYFSVGNECCNGGMSNDVVAITKVMFDYTEQLSTGVTLKSIAYSVAPIDQNTLLVSGDVLSGNISTFMISGGVVGSRYIIEAMAFLSNGEAWIDHITVTVTDCGAVNYINSNPIQLPGPLVIGSTLYYIATAGQKLFYLNTPDKFGHTGILVDTDVFVYWGGNRSLPGRDYTVDVSSNRIILTYPAGDQDTVIIDLTNTPTSGVPDAPADGALYGRQNYAWAAVSPSGTSGRKILTSDIIFHIEISGLDSGDGSSAKPWATLDHAFSYISGNIDFSGFKVLLNIGPGTFVGAGARSMTGGGILQVNGAGSAQTILTSAPPDDLYGGGCVFAASFPTATQIFLNGVTLIPDQSNVGFLMGGVVGGLGPATYVSGVATDIVFDTVNTPNGLIQLSARASFISQNGAITVKQHGVTYYFTIYIVDRSSYVENAVWTFQGTPDTINYYAFCYMEGVSSYRNMYGPGVYIGTIHGLKFSATNGSHITSATAGLDMFLGNVAGTWDATSSYDGLIGAFDIANIKNALNDAAANTAGVPIGGVYRNGSVLMVRVT